MRDSILIQLIICLVSLSSINAQTQKQSGPLHAYLKHATERPTVAALTINEWTFWITYDGQSGRNPITGNDGGTYTSADYPIVFADGLVWAGIVDDPNSGQPIRANGVNYGLRGVQPGRILSTGIAQDPMAPEVRIYRIRKSVESLPNSALLKDAAITFDIPVSAVTSADIENLRNQYIRDWNEWPGDIGAPFVDENGNGAWDPGVDTPGIADADQVIWLVVNDLDATQSQIFAGSDPIGIEQQSTFWAYDDAPLRDVIFRRYRIINKSPHNLDSAYVNLHCEFDLVDFGNDLSGIDLDLQLAYIYNGQDQDPWRNGLAPPLAGGMILLQGPLIAAVGQTGRFDFRDVVDHTNHGFTAFWHDPVGTGVANPPSGDYSGTLAWYNYVRGFIPTFDVENPTPFTYMAGPMAGQETKIHVDGDPVSDPSAMFGDVDGVWRSAGNRIHWPMSGPFEIASGDTQEVILATVAGADPDGNRYSAITELRRITRNVISIFQNELRLPAIEETVAHGSTATEYHIRLDMNPLGNIAMPYLQYFSELRDDESLTINLFDDGLHNDDQAGDNIWGSAQLAIDHWQEPLKGILFYEDANGNAKIDDFQRGLRLRPGPQLTDFEIIWENGRQDGSINPGETIHIGFKLTNPDQLNAISSLYFNEKDDETFTIPAGGNLEVPELRFVTTAPENADSLIYSYQISFDGHLYQGSVVLPISPWTPPSAWQDTLMVQAIEGTNANTLAIVADPAIVTNDTYQIDFIEGAISEEVRWQLTNLANGNVLLQNQAITEDTQFPHPIVEGIQYQVTAIEANFIAFQTVANADGPIDPPTQGALAISNNGFPTHDGGSLVAGVNDRPDAARQQTNGSTWGIHTGGISRSLYETFLMRVLRSDNGSRLVPYDYEIRFTNAGGYANWAFETGALGTVPFELWNIGIGTPNDPSDDYRMVPWCLNDADFGTGGEVFDINALDHAVSGGNDDPYTDWIYWRNPTDTSPGDAGYQQFVADGLAGIYDFGGAEVMARTVLVNWNGGEVDDPTFPANLNAQMPEEGTTFRIISSKPNFPGDQLLIDTAPVAVAVPEVPLSFELAQNYPNPFNPSTTIRYALPAPMEINLSIYNVLGQRVRTAVSGRQLAGGHTLVWDGTNDVGKPVASGVYFYRLKAGPFVKTRKMMLIR